MAPFLDTLLLGFLASATSVVGYGIDIGPGPPPRLFSISQSGAGLDACPGYKATNVQRGGDSVTADLTLAGEPCNTYGDDVKDLKLKVNWESENRLHVQIYDAAENVYQVPEDTLPRPGGSASNDGSKLDFSYVEEPFSFVVTRKDSYGQALFNTTGSKLIFQSQYVQFRSSLPDDPNLYGLGEHTDPFRLNTTGYSRTLWDKDTPFVPPGQNLYGSHPVYFEHRGSEGTHGVFFLNSDGMDVLVDKNEEIGQFIEYNTIGGIVDLYFLAGPSPMDVAQQYAEIVGTPQLPPYWALGFQQCKYGYRDLFEVAEVIANYSAAKIPLEAMWNDIDYMNKRKIFTTDPGRYPPELYRQLIDYLHSHQQKSVMMNNPAIAVNYSAYDDAITADILVKNVNDTNRPIVNVVWPGPTVFPDWWAPNVEEYWTSNFGKFYNPETGFDIDGVWIDMNEAAVFCQYPCADPEQVAADGGNPPKDPEVRPCSPRPIEGFGPDFQPGCDGSVVSRGEWPDVSPLTISNTRDVSPLTKRADGDMLGLPDRNFNFPPYKVRSGDGEISNHAINLDSIHANGVAEYDTHNLYGLMMSIRTKQAMNARRPGKRTLIISRSTWSGTGKHVGHWLGDNASRWEQYRFSITGLLQFAALYQVPMVGSDICGFNDNTTEELCARWTTLGAFSPFYRNHADVSANHQELYLWESVTKAAIHIIDIRYRLLDYIYTQFRAQTVDGTPFILPMYFLYPNDANTFPIEHQYFYGDALLISPVLYEGSTSVDAYFPDDIFYDFITYAPLTGTGSTITLSDIPTTDIPLHIRGGTIIPSRVSGANTTTETRKKDFRIIVAPGKDGNAKGKLYLDDGENEEQAAVSNIEFSFDGTTLKVDGEFGYEAGVQVAEVVFAGQEGKGENGAVTVEGPWGLDGAFEVKVGGY